MGGKEELSLSKYYVDLCQLPEDACTLWVRGGQQAEKDHAGSLEPGRAEFESGLHQLGKHGKVIT